MIEIRRLIWDPGNVGHIARHRVTLDEVEQVCHGEHVRRQAYGGRIMLIGPTSTGRLLSVVLEPESEGAYWPVTARSASRKERRLFETESGGRKQP